MFIYYKIRVYDALLVWKIVVSRMIANISITYDHCICRSDTALSNSQQPLLQDISWWSQIFSKHTQYFQNDLSPLFSIYLFIFFFPEKYIDPQYFSNLVHRHLKKLSSVNKRLWKNGTHPLYIMFRIFETYGSIVTISFVLFPAFLSSHSSLISFASSRLRTHAFLLQNANSKDPIIA